MKQTNNASSGDQMSMTESELIREAVERRRAVRKPAQHKRGIIKFGPSGQEIPCAVHDLTSEGAGLTVTHSFGLPEFFQLSIENERQERYCRLIWVDGKRIGVKFQ